MKIKTLFLALLFGSFSFKAQQALDTRKFIEVTGTSETEVTPDIIYLTITLLERMDGKEKVTIEKQEGDLKKGLKEIGIDLANFTLNSANADYRTIRKKTNETLISKSYGLKVSTTDLLAKVYAKLDAMNAYDAFVSRYSHTKIIEFQKENRMKAMVAAKEKAEYLLGAIGQQAGSALQISEVENYVEDAPSGGIRGGRAMSANYMTKRESDTEDTIAFKSIKIRSSFLVKFEILSK